MTDIINNPPHYECENVSVTIEPIQLCEQCGFLLGNALKYLFRYQHKGKPLEDLKKAEFYLNRYLESSPRKADLTVFDRHGLIFDAFCSKDFFSRWCWMDDTEFNINHILDWTRDKIKALEND